MTLAQIEDSLDTSRRAAPQSPARVELLADGSTDLGSIAVAGHDACMLTTTGTVVRPDLVDGTTETILEGIVDSFVVLDYGDRSGIWLAKPAPP